MKEVFESHPAVDKIFVAKGMPFFKYNEALNFAGGHTDAVSTVTRDQAMQEAATEAEKAEANAKAKAELEKAAAEKVEADAKAKAESEKVLQAKADAKK